MYERMYERKITYYLEVMESNNEEVRQAAAEALGRLSMGAVPALIKAAHIREGSAREQIVKAVNKIGGSGALPRKILAETCFSPQERVAILDKLRHNPFFYKFPDTPALCRKVLSEQNAAAYSGAREVLNWLEGDTLLRASQRDHSAEAQELVRAAEGATLESRPETLLRASDEAEENATPPIA